MSEKTLSAYEIQSLMIARWQLWTFVAADAIALIGTCITGILVHSQLKMVRRNVLLSLRQEATRRPARFHESLAGEDRPHDDDAGNSTSTP